MPEPPRLLQSVPVTSDSGVELVGWPQVISLHQHTRAEPLIGGFCLLSAPEGKGREVLQNASASEEGDPGTRAAHAPGWVTPWGSQPTAPVRQQRSRTGAGVLWEPSLQRRSGLCPPVGCLFVSDCPVLGLVENFGTERSLPLPEGLSLNEKYLEANILNVIKILFKIATILNHKII